MYSFESTQYHAPYNQTESSVSLGQSMTIQSFSKPDLKDSQVNVELYDCGCKVRFYQIDPSEWEGDLPEKRVTVRELSPCFKHSNNGHTIPPKDARLVTVFGEHESFLNE